MVIHSCKHVSPEYFRLKFANEMFKLKALNICHFHSKYLKFTKCPVVEKYIYIDWSYSRIIALLTLNMHNTLLFVLVELEWISRKSD